MRTSAFGVMAGCLLSSASGADWPHLRGPNYDAVSSERGLAESWPAAGPPLLWSRELDQGHSGFIVAKGKAYTQRQSSRGQVLLCLDPETGETIWESRYDWAWQPKGAYPGPYATPTWADDKVYCCSPTGRIACFDAGSGDSLWSVDARERFQGRGCEFGYAATPLVENGRVILPIGGPAASLVALSAVDGSTIWTSGGDPASYCPAFPISIAGRRCIVGYLQNSFVLVDAVDGKQLHRQSFSTGYDEHSAWPLYREPQLLLASAFRQPALQLQLRAEAGDAVPCSPRWTSRELSNDIVSSVLHQGHIYGFDIRQLQASTHRPSRGAFKCLEWTTGKLCWSTNLVGHAAVLVADDKLFLLDDTGKLILARADPTGYHELARVPLFEGEICWTPPTLWEGRLLVRSPSRAVCLYVGRPESLPEGASLAGIRPTSRFWRIDASWLLSRERDYPNDAPTIQEMTIWYVSCLAVFGAAALTVVILVLLVSRLFNQQLLALPAFLGLASLLGFLGPNVFSSLLDQCLFTWPACLYAVFHGTMLAYRHAEIRKSRRLCWGARLALVGFIGVAWCYFELCKSIGMFIGWSFLVGFPMASPLTYFAVRRQSGSALSWIGALWMLLAFTAFFWNGQVVLWWKTA